jgi:cobalt-precorrin 5A hydrolase/precorrin-3B C17-methyltransferase
MGAGTKEVYMSMKRETEVHILYFTQAGEALAERLKTDLTGKFPGLKAVTAAHGKGILKTWTADHFRSGYVLLYIGACGIAVRAIAPFIGHKDSDPAVLVMDEKGRHVIPVLAGHLGGANTWAERIGILAGAEAVLTTATDVNGLFSVDSFASCNDLKIDDLQKAGVFTARLLKEGRGILHLPEACRQDLILTGDIPRELTARYTENGQADQENSFVISPALTDGGGLRLIPPCIVLGMGCRKGKSFQDLKNLAFDTLEELGIDRKSVCAIASIDAKKEEPGLVSLAAALDVPFLTYDKETLQRAVVEGWAFSASDLVMEAVGTDNVCERAAAAAGAHRIILGKRSENGMTISVGIRKLFLSFERKEGEEPGSRLYVTGIGPGSREGMTDQAWKALESSDTIVGYSVYNDLIKPLFPYKRYLTTPMTMEEERCRMALSEAAAGHTVSLICSGDPGVYGMAGLVLEMAESFPDVDVSVISGVTAAMSGAALLGAPLIHDFAVISLSDRLTKWEKIERRLKMTAEADLGIVLYNPSSRGRREHLHRAVQSLLEILPADRVCGIADRIGREGQRTRIVTLGELKDAETDMFSTVFIGSSSTQRIGDRMVTLRGYRSEQKKEIST